MESKPLEGKPKNAELTELLLLLRMFTPACPLTLWSPNDLL